MEKEYFVVADTDNKPVLTSTTKLYADFTDFKQQTKATNFAKVRIVNAFKPFVASNDAHNLNAYSFQQLITAYLLIESTLKLDSEYDEYFDYRDFFLEVARGYQQSIQIQKDKYPELNKVRAFTYANPDQTWFPYFSRDFDLVTIRHELANFLADQTSSMDDARAIRAVFGNEFINNLVNDFPNEQAAMFFLNAGIFAVENENIRDSHSILTVFNPTILETIATTI